MCKQSTRDADDTSALQAEAATLAGEKGEKESDFGKLGRLPLGGFSRSRSHGLKSYRAKPLHYRAVEPLMSPQADRDHPRLFQC